MGFVCAVILAIVVGLAAGSSRAVAQAAPDSRVVAAVDRVYPGFMEILERDDPAGLVRLAQILTQTPSPEAVTVLFWMLERCPWWNSEILALRVRNAVHAAGTVPGAAAAAALTRGATHHRPTIGFVLESSLKLVPLDERKELEAALIAALSDPNARHRTLIASVLREWQSPEALAALASRPATGSPPSASTSLAPEDLASLERRARSARTAEERLGAAMAYVGRTMPSDPAAEGRRLLWEAPDTPLERAVLAQGNKALPLAWRALREGSTEERRAAAALLGWFTDSGSVRPILDALDMPLGALTREQLLFDLNMIALLEGSPVAINDRQPLAAQHLRWLYDDLLGDSVLKEVRSAVQTGAPLLVFPDRMPAPFSVALPTTTAVAADSRAAFLNAVRRDGIGVVFHQITAVEGIARVATSVYGPRNNIAHRFWISLYRRTGDAWTPLAIPRHGPVGTVPNEPNLTPRINRNYGAVHPLKILRLDHTMERIRVDFSATRSLDSENLDNPGRLERPDATYVQPLQRYRNSEVPGVRYTAEFQLDGLTGQTRPEVWIEALAKHPDTPFQGMAQQVLGPSANDPARRARRRPVARGPSSWRRRSPQMASFLRLFRRVFRWRQTFDRSACGIDSEPFRWSSIQDRAVAAGTRCSSSGGTVGGCS